MTARCYVRVSTLDQAADNKTSLETQEQKCRGVAMMRGVDDVAVYSDAGITGSRPLHLRIEGARLVGDLKPGDVIIAAKLDRLFRSASDALQTVEKFKAQDIGVILADIGPDPVTENGVSKLFFSLLAAFAEFERVRIAERMADGRRVKAQRGGHVGGSAPYGYNIVGKGGSAKLEINDGEQHVLEMVKAAYEEGASIRAIAEGLKNAGIKSRVDNAFSHTQIHRMLTRK